MYEDRLEIGGSNGLDAATLDKSSDICGFASEQGTYKGNSLPY